LSFSVFLVASNLTATSFFAGVEETAGADDQRIDLAVRIDQAALGFSENEGKNTIRNRSETGCRIEFHYWNQASPDRVERSAHALGDARAAFASPGRARAAARPD
jgi:hypothetical protein